MGRGTMGVVYRGHDPVIDRPVALKTVILPPSLSDEERDVFLKRFFLEARIAGKLLHPNVVVTHDAAWDEASRIPFIAMELVEGESLKSRLKAEKQIPWREALAIAIPLAEALEHAHQLGIVHRDVKPANVLLTARGAPKIADFGIARLAAGHLTETGAVVGTPYFMSPEQLRGENVDGRSDVYSLGALLYNLVVGRPPFEGTQIAAIAAQVLYGEPAAPSRLVAGVPPALDLVLGRALAKSPEDRYPSATHFGRDLASLLEGESPAPAPPRDEATELNRSSSTPTLELWPKRPAPAASPERERSEPRTAEPPRKRSRWLRVTIAVAAAGALLAGFLYRQQLGERLDVYQARRALARGELEAAERMLETILEKNPSLDAASGMLAEASQKLLPHLPLGFRARHNHRIGSCTGRLSLQEGGVEYQSTAHGTWHWRSQQIQALDQKGERSLELRTSEREMLGLVPSKNYNFFLLDDSLEEKTWKRYRRLHASQRSETDRF
jgi:serine/threonine protein kinase